MALPSLWLSIISHAMSRASVRLRSLAWPAKRPLIKTHSTLLLTLVNKASTFMLSVLVTTMLIGELLLTPTILYQRRCTQRSIWHSLQATMIASKLSRAFSRRLSLDSSVSLWVAMTFALSRWTSQAHLSHRLQLSYYQVVPGHPIVALISKTNRLQAMNLVLVSQIGYTWHRMSTTTLRQHWHRDQALSTSTSEWKSSLMWCHKRTQNLSEWCRRCLLVKLIFKWTLWKSLC